MQKFQSQISKSRFLVTGGAGFIGSNLVEYLINNNAKKVIVFDNLSNGYKENLQEFQHSENFEFIEGDIRDLEHVKTVVNRSDYISHQAALGSVPRSIENPILSNDVNINGFLNILVAMKEAPDVKGFVYAASSSTYGDSKDLPKVEGKEGKPISPYAVTKAVNEMYADVFYKTYGVSSVGLRYFNVFGPKQNPDNPYAAVIPLFCDAFMNNKPPTINGDGETSRDFTFVSNAVQANIRGLFSKLDGHHVFNVACGERTSLNGMIQILNKISKKSLVPNYGPERKGDVKHSLAEISNISKKIGYSPEVLFEEGLQRVYQWYLEQRRPHAQ